MGSGVLFAVQCRGGAGEAGGGAAAAAAAGGGAAGGEAAGGSAAGGGAEAQGGSGTSHPMEGAGGETENLVARAGGEIRKVCEQMLRVETA